MGAVVFSVQGNMRVGAVTGVSLLGLLMVEPAGTRAQEGALGAAAEIRASHGMPPDAVIGEIKVVGLHGIAAEAAKARLSVHAGEKFDSEQLAADVHALNRLRWFEDVFVEAEKATCNSEIGASGVPCFELIFHVREYPFLTEVQYSRSKVLSQQQIKKLLEDKKLSPQTGMPADPVKLHRVAVAIQSELAAMGHPEAQVTIALERLSDQRARVNFQIDDGPHLPVVEVHFSGDSEISGSVLRKQMHEIAPDAWFSGFREKNVFTQEKGEADRLSLQTYFKNHGFPQARVGTPEVTHADVFSGRSLPWLRYRSKCGLRVSVPIEAGTPYRFGTTEVSADLRQKLGARKKRDALLLNVAPGQPYSQHAVDALQRAWELRLHRSAQHHGGDRKYRLQAIPTFDSAARLTSVKFDFDPEPPYVVRRVDFLGNQRFPDRYLRRRIGLEEGQALDEYALEAGLARLARTGYFQPIKKADIQISTHEAKRTADVVIHVREKGRQRVTFSGGREQFGSTLGIAYTVFNLLGMDEFLSTRIDGGPETLQLVIGLTKEGFLGSRGTLALSVFDTFLRPLLAGGVQAPFQRTQSAGVNLGWSYATSDIDAVGFNYGLSRSLTEFANNPLSSGTSGTPSAPAANLQSETSSHSLGIGWTHYSAEQNFQLTDSVSGGWLGGQENLLKSSTEYGHIFPGEIFDNHNAWAFRTTVSAAGSYKGAMPLYALFFPGDNLVRGLRPGELGPYETFGTIAPSGTTTYSAVPAGANIVAASNLEYRFPVWRGVKGATFFDAGSGLLLPNWLGPSRPPLIESTNGLLHGSTGLELSWTLPGVGVPLRINYAFNVLRLNRALLMPDGSIFRAHDRFGAPGWGLVPFF